jgi:transcriptional regulator with PAS, ATPase and Fis domain
MRKLISEVATGDTTVLITGETGTGKELIANAIHYESARAAGPLVKVNCAALSESLLESELFGHEKGAFTGAERARSGRFERADGGTLFLDEMSEMGMHVQAKLLRVLQGEAFEKVGGDKKLQPDVRVIAATNRDPLEAIEQGALRKDLYYRLNTFLIESPPLRARHEDISFLAEHFVRVYSARLKKGISSISDDALGSLREHGWPGNVRELENCIERAVVVASGEAIQRGDLPVPLSGLEGVLPSNSLNLQELERETVLRALKETDGNKAQAAARLGIYPSSLYKKLRRFGIALKSEQ